MVSASPAVNSSTLAEIFIEQNIGPLIEQKSASLKPSSGSLELVHDCFSAAGNYVVPIDSLIPPANDDILLPGEGFPYRSFLQPRAVPA
ncbi:MAG: hypothetical protein ACLP59_14750 [Bryobacteraceae bacterium]